MGDSVGSINSIFLFKEYIHAKLAKSIRYTESSIRIYLEEYGKKSSPGVWSKQLEGLSYHHMR